MEKRETQFIGVNDIEVGDRMRTADSEAVDRLARSMQDIGLRTPISIRVVDDVTIRGEDWANAYFLVTGATRLAAAKQLGWEKIECFVYLDCDEIDAQLWEIAENLHRAGLTKDERDNQIRRYAELLKQKKERGEIPEAQNVPLEIGYGKPPPAKKEVARQVADLTGLNVKTVRRALEPKPKVVRIADEPLSEAEAIERQVAAVMSAWNKAGPEARERVRDLIDRPVMDRRFA